MEVTTLKEFFHEEHTKVLDGMQVPLRARLIRVMGSYFQKTHQGFFKFGYLVLKNSELYMYDDANNKNLK